MTSIGSFIRPPKGHAIVIECAPGRAPNPVRARWMCACGARRKTWTTVEAAHKQADAHLIAAQICERGMARVVVAPAPELPEIKIDHCSECGSPAHASETDELNRCEDCRNQEKEHAP